MAIMCGHGPMSNVSAPLFLEELERSGGRVHAALLQAWWRRTFPVEREALSEVDAEVFLEELGEADGSVAAALLRTWWRGRVPDPDGWWTQSVLDSGAAFWWRESETDPSGMEVRLNDPRNAGSDGEAEGGAEAGADWTRSVLESGAPFWWRESEEEPDGIDVRLNDPTSGAPDSVPGD